MKKDRGLERHNSLVDRIEKHMVYRGYNIIYKNTEYNLASCGEIDLWAKKDDYILMFEMKATHNYKNRKKAISQLERAEKNCFPYNRVFKFYVSNYKNPQIEWIKK